MARGPISRPFAPLPPRWEPPPRTLSNSQIPQFVLLSMLLHAIFILLFGAPAGGSREGRALWGALNVVIVGPAQENAPAPVPQLEPVPAPAPAPVRRERVARPAPPRVEAAPAPPPPEPIVPERPAFDTPLPALLDRLISPDRSIEMAPALQLPPLPEPPPPPVIKLPVAPPTPVPKVEAPPVPAPVLAPKIEAPPVPAPRIEAPPVPAPVVERPPVETPPIPAVTAPPVERAPVEAPVIRTEPPAPPVIRAEPVPTPAPAIAEPPPVPAVRSESAPAARAPVPPAAREAAPAESERPSLFKSPAPSPDAGSFDPTRPRIDLDAVRQRAGELGRQGTGNRALLPFPMPPVPAKKNKMEAAIEGARKPDCRTAYQQLGLAAIVPLIANEFGEGTCKW